MTADSNRLATTGIASLQDIHSTARTGYTGDQTGSAGDVFRVLRTLIQGLPAFWICSSVTFHAYHTIF